MVAPATRSANTASLNGEVSRPRAPFPIEPGSDVGTALLNFARRMRPELVLGASRRPRWRPPLRPPSSQIASLRLSRC